MMFGTNARVYPNEAPCPQNPERLARKKHSSLSQTIINHGCKKVSKHMANV